VREIARLGGDISRLVHPRVADTLREHFHADQSPADQSPADQSPAGRSPGQ